VPFIMVDRDAAPLKAVFRVHLHSDAAHLGPSIRRARTDRSVPEQPGQLFLDARRHHRLLVVQAAKEQRLNNVAELLDLRQRESAGKQVRYGPKAEPIQKPDPPGSELNNSFTLALLVTEKSPLP
jgi:hypothetical protein